MAILIPADRGHIERGNLLEPADPPGTAAAPTFSAPDDELILGQENPFAADHRLHHEWERRRVIAAAEAAPLRARLLDQLNGRVRADYARRWRAALECDLEWGCGLFDIRAKAWLSMTRSPSTYAAILNAHADAIVSEACSLGRGIDTELVAALTPLLRQRHAHWMAQVHARALQQLAPPIETEPSRASPTSTKVTPRNRTSPRCQQQAEWLSRMMLQAGDLTPNALEELGGPDGKTTARLLKGLGTRHEGVLRKVVTGLNEANDRAGIKITFALEDIPRD